MRPAMKNRRPLLPLLASLLAGCAAPSATKGLLDEGFPRDTMAKEGDLGFDAVSFATRQVLLPSGLRLVLEQAVTRGMAGVVITVGAGSIHDPQGKEGLAHYAEHLAFRARAGERRSLGQRLDRMAATYNAHTTFDSTRYQFFAPRKRIGELMAVASDLLEKPLADVDPAAAAVEHQVVVNELRQRNETRIYGRVMGWLQAALFPATHAYARPIGGSAASLATLTLADARTFGTTHYRPDNATMVIIGDFSSDEARALLDGLPAVLAGDSSKPRSPTRATVSRAPSAPPPAPAAGHVTHTAPVSRPEAWIAWSLPSIYSQSGAEVKLVTARVVEQRLQNLFRNDPDVGSVSLIALPSRQITILACQIVFFDARKRAETTKRVLEIINGMWQPLSKELLDAVAKEVAGEMAAQLSPRETAELMKFSTAVLTGARREVLAGMQQEALAEVVFGAEAFSGRALDRADFLHVLGNHNTYLDMLRSASRLSPDAVSKFAARFLTAERARVIHVDPVPAAERPAPGLAGLSPVDRLADLDIGTSVDFGAAPAPAALPELAAARTFRLENGLEVALVPRRQFPVITAALAFHGGVVSGEPPGAVELLRLMEPAGEVAIPLNAMQVVPADGRDYTADVVRAGRNNLGNALYLLALRLVRTDRLDWDRILERTGSDQNEATPVEESVASRSTRDLLSALYGKHPYGQLLRAGQITSIKPDQMKSWTLRMRHPRNATLVVVGDFDPPAGEKMVRGWFGQWQGHGPGATLTVPAPPMPAPGPEKLLLHHRPGVSQTEVTLACRLPPFDARAATVYEVLASYVGSEILTRVRQEAGATYSVEADTVLLRGGAAHLVFSMDVDDNRLKQVLAVVRARWARLAEGGFDPGALSQTKWHIATGASMQFQTSTEMALRALDTLRLGFPVQAIDRSRADVASIDTADLAAAFRSCAGSTVISLVGDTNKIKPAL
jgi:zinc protease